MINYELLYFDRSWLLITVWIKALERLNRFIQGILTGTVEQVRHFNKVGEFIIPAKNLRQLATVSSAAASTLGHTVDAVTDCLVVCIASRGSSTADARATAVTWGAQSMTIAPSATYTLGTSPSVNSQIWFLKNPTVGSGTITATFSNMGSCVLTATNWVGTSTTPFRTGVSTGYASNVTAISLSPTSANGDIVLDCLNIAIAGWVQGGSQTSINTANSAIQVCSKKDGATGTTTMSWSGSGSILAYVSAALAGS